MWEQSSVAEKKDSKDAVHANMYPVGKKYGIKGEDNFNSKSNHIITKQQSHSICFLFID